MNDIDIWQKAVDNMDLNESVQFTSRSGYLVTEESQVEMYNKIQKLLNCDNMECSHRWLYQRDPAELTEAEATKVNNLYKLACEKGYIEDSLSEDDQKKEEEDVSECDMQQNAITEQPHPFQQPTLPPVAPSSAYTVLYSAMRNGNIATGEAYSNSIDPRSAKADVINKLEQAGYSNISILAIECGDPDYATSKPTPNTYVMQADMTPIQTQTDYDIPDYSDDIYEADKNDEDSEKSDVEKSDKNDEDSEKSDDEMSDKNDEDSEKSDDKESTKKKEETSEEPDEKLKKDDVDSEDKDELDATQKAQLKDSYKKAFKAAMLNCKYENMAFDDLSLQQKVDFFTVLSKAWGSKADPTKFMTDKEIDQLEKIVIKK